MSFSLDVKQELKDKIDGARHCQIAELSALMALTGRITNKSLNDKNEMKIIITTENEFVAQKFISLVMKIFNIPTNKIQLIYEGKKNSIINLVIQDKELIEKILKTVKWADDDMNIKPVFAAPILLMKDCCKRAFIRGAFLASGSISDPNKFYHYEIVCDYEKDAEQLSNMMHFFGLDAKVISRKKNYVVYLKEGNNITDVLNHMGAFVSQMNLFNVMILKDMRNDVNRKVNCETANLNKTIEAAVKQIRDIEYIRDEIGLENIGEGLKDIAMARLENPDMNLKDLGELLEPPVGKSGVNHRLRKISDIADKLRQCESFSSAVKQ